MPFHPSEMTEGALRRLVDNLVRHTKTHPLSESSSRAQVQEAVAAALGWPNYHSAITTLKNAHHADAGGAPDGKSSAGEAWTVPRELWSQAPDYCWNRLIRPSAPMEDTQKRQDPLERRPIAPIDFAEPLVVDGTEAERRAIIAAVVRDNPHHPICLIQGPMSLCAPLPNAEMIGSVSAEQVMAHGTAAQIQALVLKHLTPGEDPTPHDVWVERALHLLRVVVPVWVEDRDTARQKRSASNRSEPNQSVPHRSQGHRQDGRGAATVSSLLDLLALEVVQRQSQRTDLAEPLRTAVQRYVQNLPGYREDAPDELSVTMREMHGYLQTQIAGALERMTDSTAEPLTAALSPRPTHRTGRGLHVRLPENALHPSELHEIQQAIQSWTDRHPYGLVVVDALPRASVLWPWVTNRLARWRDRNMAFWVGIHTQADIPAAVADVLLPRMGNHIRLSGLLWRAAPPAAGAPAAARIG